MSAPLMDWSFAKSDDVGVASSDNVFRTAERTSFAGFV
jgi:hypothetical protein